MFYTKLLIVFSLIFPLLHQDFAIPSVASSLDLHCGPVFIASKNGVIYENGVSTIDLSSKVDHPYDLGLLTIRTNPSCSFLYAVYTITSFVGEDRPRQIILSRFPLDDLRVDQEQVIFDKAWAHYVIHAGGGLAFESDDILYLAIGESTLDPSWHVRPSAQDWRLRAQNLDSFNGKVLRMHAVTGQPLPTNPYYDELSLSAPYIYALGFRNPFRMAMISNTVYLGDVGDAAFEEIDVVQAKGNYGWPYYEGPLPHASGVTTTEPLTLTPPVLFYARSGHDSSITGIALWKDNIWIADYGWQALRNMSTGAMISTTVRPTDLQVGSDQCIYYVGFDTDLVSDLQKICDPNSAIPPPQGSTISTTLEITQTQLNPPILQANRFVTWNIGLIHGEHIHPDFQIGQGISITVNSLPLDHGNGLRACASDNGEHICMNVQLVGPLTSSRQLLMPLLLR